MTLRLNGSTSGYVEIDAPAVAGSNTLVLPTGNGSNGQALTTNGSGTLNWATLPWQTSGNNIYYTTGAVSVGTTSALGMLQVSSGSSYAFVSVDANDLFVENSGNAGITIGTPNTNTGSLRFTDPESSNAGSISYNHFDDSLRFGTAATERMKIDSSGRLLVGTSTARSTGTVTWLSQIEGGSLTGLGITTNGNDTSGAYVSLAKSRGTTLGSSTIVQNNDVLGAILFSGADGVDADSQAASIQCNVDGTPGANDMPGRLVFSTTADGASSPTERMRITQNGRLYCPGVYDFYSAVGANVYVQSDGNLIRATSSSKYKTNIETIEDSYSNALLNCRPVWFRSTSEVDNPNWGFWGFIAEEVAEIDPRLVQWRTTKPVATENGSVEHIPCEPEPEGVQYDRFVPHLLNLIKRQQQAIETLEASNADLLARVSALESA